jgi:hypothetical protein
MGSNNKSKQTNGNYCINYTIVAKNFFFERISYNNMRYNTESWKNENVDLRMTKKSEKMLIENWITTTSRIEERSIKITIG